MVAGNRVAVRLGSAPPTNGSGGTPHYILQRTVVLDKVEVRRGDGAERNAKIAHHGNSLQKNLWQQNGRAPVEINPAGVHLPHQRAEQTKIVMRGIAKRSAVSGRMHVRNIRANGEVNRHWDALLVRREENAGICVLDLKDAAVQKLSRGFTVSDAQAVRQLRDFVEVFSSFFRHAEPAFVKSCFHIFGRVAGERDLEIMNERSPIHRDSRNETAVHQIDQERTETNFYNVPADPPENRSALSARTMNRAKKLAKIFGGENLRKRIKKFRERNVCSRRLRKLADAHLALSRSKRIRVNRTKRDGLNGIDTHGAMDTLTRTDRNTKRMGRLCLRLAYNVSVNDKNKSALIDGKLIAAKWYLGELSGEDMPGIACQALEEGHEGKNLRLLAGLLSPVRRDIHKIVDGAMQELGVQAPVTLHDAALWMARRLADEIVEGLIDPYGGACRIWLSYSSEAPELAHWSNLAINYEVEAATGKTEKAKLQILQAARNLLSSAK
jgi:hypothetical protein